MILMEFITLTTIPTLVTVNSLTNPNVSSTESTTFNTNNSYTPATPAPSNLTSDYQNKHKPPQFTGASTHLRIETKITFGDDNSDRPKTSSKPIISSTISKNVSSPIQFQHSIEFELTPAGQPTPSTSSQVATATAPERIIFDETQDQDSQHPRHDLSTAPNCTETQTVYNETCFTVLQQLPCPAGQWLVEDEKLKIGKCVENKCAGADPDTAFYDGKCVKVKSEDSCSSGMKTYIFKSGQVECDCKEGFLYDKKSGNCYEAYRQGPCQKTQYFAIPTPKIGQTGQLNPTCIQNPCIIDGYFCKSSKCPIKKTTRSAPTIEQISRNCVKFGTNCTQSGRGLFVIHPDSNTPACIHDIMDISRPDRVIGNVPTLKCAPGSRRDILGHCRAPTVIDFS